MEEEIRKIPRVLQHSGGCRRITPWPLECTTSATACATSKWNFDLMENSFHCFVSFNSTLHFIVDFQKCWAGFTLEALL